MKLLMRSGDLGACGGLVQHRIHGRQMAATELASLASTVISSDTLPRARVMGTSVGWPAAICTGVLLVAKPEASTWMVYLPAARLARLLALGCRRSPLRGARSSLRTVTAAPGQRRAARIEHGPGQAGGGLRVKLRRVQRRGKGKASAAHRAMRAERRKSECIMEDSLRGENFGCGIVA